MLRLRFLKEKSGAKGKDGCIIRFRIRGRINVKLNIRRQRHPLGNTPGPVALNNFFAVMVEFGTDGIFVYFVIGKGQAYLV